MPELPEVETIKRDLEKAIIDKEILDVVVRRKNIVKEPALADFVKALRHSRCRNVLRRGKLLVLELFTREKKTRYLTIHLRMSGQVVYGKDDPASRVSFQLSDASYLCYNDQRALGELRVVDDWRALKVVRSMGPEPLDKEFTFEEFRKRLGRKTGKIKALLLDQRFIAGIGNIYAAEALFLSGINPEKKACSLDGNESKRLFDNIRKVLLKAIKCRGSSFNTYRDGLGQKGSFSRHFLVYGRKGAACFNCKSPIRRIVLGGRGTYFCGKCQK